MARARSSHPSFQSQLDTVKSLCGLTIVVKQPGSMSVSAEENGASGGDLGRNREGRASHVMALVRYRAHLLNMGSSLELVSFMCCEACSTACVVLGQALANSSPCPCLLR